MLLISIKNIDKLPIFHPLNDVQEDAQWSVNEVYAQRNKKDPIRRHAHKDPDVR